MTFNEGLEKAVNGDRQEYYLLCGQFIDCLYTIAYIALRNEQDSCSAVDCAVEESYSCVASIKDELHLRAWLVRELTKETVALLKRYKNEKSDTRRFDDIFPTEGLSDVERLVFGIHISGRYNSHEISLITGLSEEVAAAKLKNASEKLGDKAVRIAETAAGFYAPDKLIYKYLPAEEPESAAEQEYDTGFTIESVFSPESDEDEDYAEEETPAGYEITNVDLGDNGGTMTISYDDDEDDDTAAAAAQDEESAPKQEAYSPAEEAYSPTEEVYSPVETEPEQSEEYVEDNTEPPVFADGEYDPPALNARTFINAVSAEHMKGSEFLRLIGNTRISNSVYREIEQNPGLTRKRLIYLLEQSPLTEADYYKLFTALKQRREMLSAREERRAQHEKAGLYDGSRRRRSRKKLREESKSDLRKALEQAQEARSRLTLEEQKATDGTFDPFSGTANMPETRLSRDDIDAAAYVPQVNTDTYTDLDTQISSLSRSAEESLTAEQYRTDLFSELLNNDLEAVDPFQTVALRKDVVPAKPRRRDEWNDPSSEAYRSRRKELDERALIKDSSKTMEFDSDAVPQKKESTAGRSLVMGAAEQEAQVQAQSPADSTGGAVLNDSDTALPGKIKTAAEIQPALSDRETALPGKIKTAAENHPALSGSDTALPGKIKTSGMSMNFRKELELDDNDAGAGEKTQDKAPADNTVKLLFGADDAISEKKPENSDAPKRSGGKLVMDLSESHEKMHDEPVQAGYSDGADVLPEKTSVTDTGLPAAESSGNAGLTMEIQTADDRSSGDGGYFIDINYDYNKYIDTVEEDEEEETDPDESGTAVQASAGKKVSHRTCIVVCAVCAALLIIGGAVFKLFFADSSKPQPEETSSPAQTEPVPASSAAAPAQTEPEPDIEPPAGKVMPASFSGMEEIFDYAFLGVKDVKFGSEYLKADALPYSPMLSTDVCFSGKAAYIHSDGVIRGAALDMADPHELGTIKLQTNSNKFIGFAADESFLYVLLEGEKNERPFVNAVIFDEKMELYDSYTQDGSFVGAGFSGGQMTLITEFSANKSNADKETARTYAPAYIRDNKRHTMKYDRITPLEGAYYSSYTVVGIVSGKKTDYSAFLGGYKAYAGFDPSGCTLLIADENKTFARKISIGSMNRTVTDSALFKGESFCPECLDEYGFIGYDPKGRLTVTKGGETAAREIPSELPCAAAFTDDGKCFSLTRDEGRTLRLYCFDLSGSTPEEIAASADSIYTAKLTAAGASLAGLRAETGESGERTGLRLSLYGYDGKLTEKASYIIGTEPGVSDEYLKYLSSGAEKNSAYIASNAAGTELAVSAAYFDGTSQVQRTVLLHAEGDKLTENGSVLSSDTASAYILPVIRDDVLYIITENSISAYDVRTCQELVLFRF